MLTPSYPAFLYPQGGEIDVAQFVVLAEWDNAPSLACSDGTAFGNGATRSTTGGPSVGEAYVVTNSGASQTNSLVFTGLTPGSLVVISAMVVSKSGGGTFWYVGSGDVIQSLFPMSAVGGTPSANGELPQTTWRNVGAALYVAPDGTLRLVSLHAAAIARMKISVAVPSV